MSIPNQKTQATGIDLDAFSWTYAQKTGELQKDGAHVANGYSGAGDGKNNPELQTVHNVGPIPEGDWTISGPPVNTAAHGPYVLRLTPNSETETFGRSGFLMHGDSQEHPGEASQGCIIMPRPVRQQVWTSGDRDLKVVADAAEAPEEEK
jgi:type VI secretion system (T6SS) effector TldE1-like protein